MHRFGITALHAQKADACICIVPISCELMEALLGFLDEFDFCFESVTGAFCVPLNNSEELYVRQRQLLVSAAFHVDQCEMPDVL